MIWNICFPFIYSYFSSKLWRWTTFFRM